MLKEARSLNKIYLSDSDLDTLSYACAEAEMMWRRRANHPDEYRYENGKLKYTPEECRRNMFRYREMWRKVNKLINRPINITKMSEGEFGEPVFAFEFFND